jgi:chromate transporter
MTWLALQGFGGVLAVVQRVLVDEKGWLTNEEFIEDWAVAQILPGPNVVNGGLAALAGILTFPLFVVLIIAALFASVADMPMAQGALKGMGAVSAGLIAAVGLRLITALKTNVMSAGVCIALAAMTFIAIAVLRMPLVWVLLGLGGVATLWAYRQLGQVAQINKEQRP